MVERAGRPGGIVDGPPAEWLRGHPILEVEVAGEQDDLVGGLRRLTAL